MTPKEPDDAPDADPPSAPPRRRAADEMERAPFDGCPPSSVPASIRRRSTAVLSRSMAHVARTASLSAEEEEESSGGRGPDADPAVPPPPPPPPRNTTNPFGVFDERVVVAMVGLPARGKSYLSKATVRYLNFLGCPTELFNAGNMRRKEGLAGTDASFFDPSNVEGKAARERMAMDCLEELLQWTKRPGGGCSVGILDATNTTVARRKKILDRIETEAEADPNVKLVFVESYADDEELLESNYRMKLVNDDYRGRDPEKALADFRERVRKYEAVYESITDEEARRENMRYIKIINAGRCLIANLVEGYTLGKIQRLLGTVGLWPRTIWLVLGGETENDPRHLSGGDPALSDAGLEYVRSVRRLIEERSCTCPESRGEGPTTLLMGTLRRYVQAANVLAGNPSPLVEWRVLTLAFANDVCEGSLDQLSEEERTSKFPEEVAARSADRLNYRYPGSGGESYQDVIARCNEVTCLLEQLRGDSVVLCDRAVYRVLLGYFTGRAIEEIPHLDVKEGVLEMRRNHVGFEASHLEIEGGRATSSAGRYPN